MFDNSLLFNLNLQDKQQNSLDMMVSFFSPSPLKQEMIVFNVG